MWRRGEEEDGAVGAEHLAVAAAVVVVLAAFGLSGGDRIGEETAEAFSGTVSCVVDTACDPGERRAGPPTADDEEPPLSAEDLGLDDLGRQPLRVIRRESVTWNDGSLGCGQPGQAYTMALVPGERMVVEVDGEQRVYHRANGGSWFHCARPTQA